MQIIRTYNFSKSLFLTDFGTILAERELVIPAVKPKKGSKIFMLGYKKALNCSLSEDCIKVEIPDILQSPENRPCEHAWGFRIEVE
jgi:hypothetical protein